MDESNLKGKILETLLKYFLANQGYQVIPSNIQNYYNVSKQHHGVVVKGRGAWHQIDTLGQFKFQIPFVYPVRLLAEAKYRKTSSRKKTLGLPDVRNFVGVVKDISENYVINDPSNANELNFKKRFRFTDVGAIFSTLPFSHEAQSYAHAQGVFLVPCVNLGQYVDQIFNHIKRDNEFKKEFLKFIKGIDKGISYSFNNFFNENTQFYIYFGTVMGLYPIVITSDSEFPIDSFRDSDLGSIQISYEYLSGLEQRELKNFEIKLNNWVGKFELPLYMFDPFLQTETFKKDMINFKQNNINYIDIPMTIGNIRRIIRLQIDKNWIGELKENKSNY